MIDLLQSWLTVTWYPGVLGYTGGSPWVLLDETDHLDPGSPFAAMMGQAVGEARYVRGAQPEHFSRGNASAGLSLTKVLLEVDPAEATELVLAHVSSLPTQTGWLLVEIAGKDTTWSLDQVVFEGLEGTMDPFGAGTLGLAYRFKAGALAVYDGEVPASTYAEGEVIAGPGTVNRGALLLGPNRTWPEE